MNLILLDPADFLDDETVRLSGRRARHIIDILQSRPGDRVTVGSINGPVGQGRIVEVGRESVTLEVELGDPPPRPRVSLVLAMVRPQVMKRVLEHLATLGVRRIMLVGARRVERSYFGQRLFDGDQYREHLRLGLEQARDTWMPEVTIHRRFKPFIEDVLPEVLPPGSVRIVAHPPGPDAPGSANALPFGGSDPDPEVFLAVGPEGGWVEYEVQRFLELGFQPLSLGSRILRVETAIPYLFGKLDLSLRPRP